MPWRAGAELVAELCRDPSSHLFADIGGELYAATLAERALIPGLPTLESLRSERDDRQTRDWYKTASAFR